MKRFLCWAGLCVALLAPRASHAQLPLGSVAKVFPYTPSKVLADPARSRVYALDTASNSLVVIDTTALKAVATLPVGSNPVDMAISLDGSTLYVANNGSTLQAIGVVDLNALTLRPGFALPGSALAVAAGLGNRVYASASSNFSTTIYQFDGTTGAMQATFNPNAYDNNLFQLSPDGKTLFVASKGTSPGSLRSFDVSTATPAALQTNSQASENDSQLVISHNGKFLCLPSGGGNAVSGSPYTTFLFSTADVTKYFGSFNNGAYPGPLAFSPDDALAYQTRTGGAAVVDVFDTKTFFKLKEVNLPAFGSQGYPDEVSTIVADNTGSYLFVGESSFNGNTTTGQLAVITTGAGTLTPPSVLPVITSALSPAVTQGVAFTYQITASGAPTGFGAANLPAGLSVNTATGLISGTPTVNGYFQVPITASNASGTATANLTLNVQYGTASFLPVFGTSSLPGAVVGQAYSATVFASNSPSYAATGLPAGLSLNAATGVISGTPTAAGTASVALSAANSYGTARVTLPLTTAPAAPAITSGNAASGTLGAAFTYQITASNGGGNFAATGLPTGLSVNGQSGLISGTPLSAGTYSVLLGAINAGGSGTLTLTLTIANPPAPVITSAAGAAGQVGVAFTYQITATNSVAVYSAAGLPAGLSVNAATGLISGTPTAAGTAAVTLSASNLGGAGTGTLTLAVAPNLPTVTLLATTPTANAGDGSIGVFTLSLSAAQTGDLAVRYTVKGSAANGTDYILLTGTKKVKAGKASRSIKVIPLGATGGAGTKSVVLTLAPGDGYVVGTPGKVKVKIITP